MQHGFPYAWGLLPETELPAPACYSILIKVGVMRRWTEIYFWALPNQGDTESDFYKGLILSEIFNKYL